MGVFERQLREETILNAAAKVFCSRGFGSAKMIHVAKEAKLSKGLLYFYYKSKDDLYMAVILHAIKMTIQFHKYELTQNKEENGLERLMILMNQYFEFMGEHPYYQDAISTFINMMHPLKHEKNKASLTKGMKESPYYKQIKQLKFEPFKLITEAMTQGKHDGSIKTNLPPVYLYLSVWSLMIGYERLSIEGNEIIDDTGNSMFNIFNDKHWQETIRKIVRTILTTP